MERAKVRKAKKNITGTRVAGYLYKAMVILVIVSAFMVYFARLPETGAYFNHQINSHTYKVEIKP